VEKPGKNVEEFEGKMFGKTCGKAWKKYSEKPGKTCGQKLGNE
jgi:hypothetical protein